MKYSGGIIGKMSKRKGYRDGLSVNVEKEVTDVKGDPADRDDGTGQSYKEKAGQDTEPKTPEAVTGINLPEQTSVNQTPIVNDKRIYFNPGNLEQRKQGYAGDTGKTYANHRGTEHTLDTQGNEVLDKRKPFIVFDSAEAGIRGLARDLMSKLNRFNGDAELALLQYLGGDTGTLEERYAKAGYDNENPTGYIKRAVEEYKKNGLEGLVAKVIKEENTTDIANYYLTPSIFNKAMQIAQYDYPTGTTTEQMIEDLTSGIFRTK